MTPPRPEVMGDLRLRAERAEARAAVAEARVVELEAEIANRKFVAAARPSPSPVEPLHGWDVQ